jgi:hypothetical protein
MQAGSVTLGVGDTYQKVLVVVGCLHTQGAIAVSPNNQVHPDSQKGVAF